MAVVGKNDVVKDGYFQQYSCLFKFSGQLNVCIRGIDIATGMVMRQNHGTGYTFQGYCKGNP